MESASASCASCRQSSPLATRSRGASTLGCLRLTPAHTVPRRSIHCTSGVAHSRSHLCPTGPRSRRRWFWGKAGKLFQVTQLVRVRAEFRIQTFLTTNAWTFQAPCLSRFQANESPSLVQALSQRPCFCECSLDLITSHLQHWQWLPSPGGSLGWL